jgi:hypothetical protein
MTTFATNSVYGYLDSKRKKLFAFKTRLYTVLSIVQELRMQIRNTELYKKGNNENALYERKMSLHGNY